MPVVFLGLVLLVLIRDTRERPDLKGDITRRNQPTLGAEKGGYADITSRDEWAICRH